MNSPLVIAVDCSTTAAKAIVVDRTGRVVGDGAHPLATASPAPHWFEQNAADWWTATDHAVRQALTHVEDLGSVAAIREIQMELTAGSAGVTLPNLTMTGTIEANAGSIRLCVPAGVGLRIETGGSVAASYDFHDLVQDGSVWTSPGYAEAAVRIDLRTDGTAASFTLDPEGGCDG